MHSAPSVSYPVGRSRDAERLLWGIWAIGACCAAAACYQFDSVGRRAGLLALSVAAVGVAIGRCALRRDGPVELSFDGQHWSLAGVAALRTARAWVALDLQSSLLVQLAEPGRARHWVWLDRNAMPERWQALRRAVYSRAPSAGQAAGAPQATSADAHHPHS